MSDSFSNIYVFVTLFCASEQGRKHKSIIRRNALKAITLFSAADSPTISEYKDGLIAASRFLLCQCSSLLNKKLKVKRTTLVIQATPRQ